jgi:hypothetical protein
VTDGSFRDVPLRNVDDKRWHSSEGTVLQVPTHRMHLYTVVQLVCLACCWYVGYTCSCLQCSLCLAPNSSMPTPNLSKHHSTLCIHYLAIRVIKSTPAGLAFPLFIVLLVPFRNMVCPYDHRGCGSSKYCAIEPSLGGVSSTACIDNMHM